MLVDLRKDAKLEGEKQLSTYPTVPERRDLTFVRRDRAKHVIELLVDL